MIKISIKQRIQFAGIFAGNSDTMTEAAVQRSIRDLIAIGKDEAEEISLSFNNGSAVWKPAKAIEKQFELDQVQTAYLKESIFNLSKSRMVSQDLLPICELINSI
jgi:hypothetical protein